jgi:hypothetical protein
MNNETCECKCCDLLADKLAAMTKERDRWQEDSMRQAATINRMSAAAEDRNEVDQLRHAEHEKELKYEKMNTEVWRRDAEGKLKDRTAAYRELAAAQAQIAQLREALGVVCKPVMDSYAGPARLVDFNIALAIPTDTAALDARLAQERERCAVECAKYASNTSHQDVAAAIREMK